jgi:hypothetical protein
MNRPFLAAIVVACLAIPFMNFVAAQDRPATPLAPSPVATSLCGPVTGPAATPIAATPPSADDEITAELSDAVSALVRCWNARNWMAYASYLAPDLRMERFGSDDIPAIAASLTLLDDRGLVAPIAVDSARFGRFLGGRIAAIQVAWHEGFATYHESWTYVRSGGAWQLDDATPIETILTGPAVGLQLRLTDQGIEAPRDQIAQTALTVLEAVNETGGPFTLTVFSLPSGVDPAALVLGSTRAHLAGTRSIDSESTQSLVLEDLPAGEYVVAIGLEQTIATGDTTLLHFVRLTVTPVSSD